VPGQRPHRHRHPTAEQLDERVSLPLSPEQAIEAILATGPHSDKDETEDEKKAPTE
jgi:hypothetical protein